MVVVYRHRLGEAMALPYDEPPRDQLVDHVRADVRDELMGDVAQQSAGTLLPIRGRGS